MNNSDKIPVEVYAESTPNPQTMKFVFNQLVIEEGQSYEFNNPSEASQWPIVKEIFKFEFVAGVFMSSNFIAITKNNNENWDSIVIDLRIFLKNYFESCKLLYSGEADNGFKKSVNKDDIETKIKQILKEYVQPAVEQDGGAIQFSSFQDGILTVKLKGACHGCPSATLTLKSGIEQLFHRLFPEVKQVVSEDI